MGEAAGKKGAGLLEFCEGRGRVELCMTVQRLGADYSVSLFGGEAHVGAVALALPQANPLAGHGAGHNVCHNVCVVANTDGAESVSTAVLVVPGHREDELAQHVARTLAAALHCRVSVVCGIHYDRISREEIALVLALADSLTQRALHALSFPSLP